MVDGGNIAASENAEDLDTNNVSNDNDEVHTLQESTFREADRQQDALNASRFQVLFNRFVTEPIDIEVHDVLIYGNRVTKDSLIEAQFEGVKNACNTMELLQEVAKANMSLQSLGIFEKCTISLEPGPTDLPRTVNVLVEVEELKKPYSGEIGVFSKPETRSWSVDGSIKWKNFLGYGETWDSTGSYGWDGGSEMSAGVHYPRFKGLPISLVLRTSVFTQDWQKYSSYKERLTGFSVGFMSQKHHDLSYNLTWRMLDDPAHVASRSVRQELGHSLLSSIKYTFKVDSRDCSFRPKKGFAFRSATQVAGIGLDKNLLRFVRQEFDIRCSVPFGFYNTALNVGLSGGLIIPWGEGYRQKIVPISDRFFMGGQSSLVCDMNGPGSLAGFYSRGVGPTQARRKKKDAVELRDNLGGGLAITGFADLSSDLPLKFLRDQNIHGHCFVCAGTLMGLPQLRSESLSMERFLSSLRCSAGIGIVIPTKLFRLEVNFCHILKKFCTDDGKRGIQLCFSAPQ